MNVPVAAAAKGKPEPDAPDWLYSLQPAGRSPDASADATALADAAAMPVQVRRSRVPVLSVDVRRAGAPSVATMPQGPGMPDATVPADGAGAARRPTRPLLILALVVLIAVLAYLVLRFVL